MCSVYHITLSVNIISFEIRVEDLDMSSLSLHQAKRLEMEAQVRILELEQALETERLRLAALRRYHYQLDGDNEA